jgi:hypothetical protein
MRPQFPTRVEKALNFCKTGGNHQHKHRSFKVLQMFWSELTGADQESNQEGSKEGTSSAPCMDLTPVCGVSLILI